MRCLQCCACCSRFDAERPRAQPQFLRHAVNAFCGRSAMGCCFATSVSDADMEGQRTVGFGEAMKSSFVPLTAAGEDGLAANPENPFPTNFVRVSKYPSYLTLWFSFTFTDFFIQVRRFRGGQPFLAANTGCCPHCDGVCRSRNFAELAPRTSYRRCRCRWDRSWPLAFDSVATTCLMSLLAKSSDQSANP